MPPSDPVEATSELDAVLFRPPSEEDPCCPAAQEQKHSVDNTVEYFMFNNISST